MIRRRDRKNLSAIIYVPKNELMTTQNRNINLKTLRKTDTNVFISLLKFSLKSAQNYTFKLRYRVKFSAVNSSASKICNRISPFKFAAARIAQYNRAKF